jgi:hypothetical protein
MHESAFFQIIFILKINKKTHLAEIYFSQKHFVSAFSILGKSGVIGFAPERGDNRRICDAVI